MNPFSSLWHSLLRRRHSRGFGIHSPYAYRFVTDVVRPRIYGYYAYDDIDADDTIPARSIRTAKWYVRLLIFLKPARILFFRVVDAPAKTASDCLGIQSEILRNPAAVDFAASDFLIITNGNESPPNIVLEAINSGAKVLIFNPDKNLVASIISTGLQGLLLEDKRKMLFIPRDEMAFTHYHISF